MDLWGMLERDMNWLFTEEGRKRLRSQARPYAWTEEEDEIVLKHFPNIAFIIELLPFRTAAACRFRARRLGLTERDRSWSDAEIRWLRKNYENASWEDIARYLPKRSKGAVKIRAFKLRLRRERNFPPPIGVGLIDDIRARARQLNFSLRDLDEEAGRASYFRLMRAKAPPVLLRIAALEAAVKAMGGRIEIRWSDQ